MNFYKITNGAENHNGLQYHDGLNIDPVPFNAYGDCQPGGMYYAREDILAFVNMGCWIRQVTVPDNVMTYLNPGYPIKWKSNMLFLHPRKPLWEVETFKELIADGVNPKVNNSFALRMASVFGYIEIVKLLIPLSDPLADDCVAIRRAASYGYSDIVNLLIPVSDPEIVKTLNIKGKHK